MTIVRSRTARTSGGQKLLALVLVGVVIYYLWLQGGIGYPGGVPGAPIILSPIPMQPFNIAEPITVSWRLPSGVIETSYRIIIGNQDFSNIQRDTGKIGGNTTTTTIIAPTVTGTHYLKLCYWDNKDVQSNPATVQIAITLVTTPQFSITPDRSFSVSWNGRFTLDIQNNANYDIEQIKVKLIELSGIFNSFSVESGTSVSPFFSSCLNQFNTANLYFSAYPNDKVLAGDMQTMRCSVVVDNTAPAGTYTLVWVIAFLASDASAPPSLQIPWTVTIYG